jgi:hypothetical protein
VAICASRVRSKEIGGVERVISRKIAGSGLRFGLMEKPSAASGVLAALSVLSAGGKLNRQVRQLFRGAGEARSEKGIGAARGAAKTGLPHLSPFIAVAMRAQVAAGGRAG